MYTCSVFGMVQYLLHPLFSAKKICFVKTEETNSPRQKEKQKIQLRHNFVVFLLNEKTEKVQTWADSAIVFENHILL